MEGISIGAARKRVRRSGSSVGCGSLLVVGTNVRDWEIKKRRSRTVGEYGECKDVETERLLSCHQPINGGWLVIASWV